MNKRAAILLTLVVATFSIAAPIWVAVEESRKQGYRDEADRVLLYAKDVLHRSDTTADQVSRGIRKMKGMSGTDACSEAGIALMREVDLASSHILAFGYVAGDRLMCSSLGMNNTPLALGPADLTTARGTVIRKNVKLPFARNISFISLEQLGYAGIIHKDLPIDTSTVEADVALAIFARGHRNPLSVKGKINPDWVKALKSGDELTFSDGNHIVAVAKSKRYLSVAVAAMPISYLQTRTNVVAKRLVPVGVIAGILLSLAIFWLARIQMALPTAIRAALKRDEFFMLYQPIVDLKTGQWVGAEALIRWQRTAGEIVSPDVFIPIAEENGLIKRITERVLQLAARDICDGFQLHPDFHVAINLSAADLHSATTPALLARFLSQTGAHPSNLIVEATERGFLQVDIALKITNAIRAQGIALAIDDFGTGYSSLSCLQLFKLDFLKIDKSFVETIGTDAPTSHVVAHIIEMAKDMGMEMIAEGVETEAQACYLREHGVRYAQGWLYGRPMPFNVIMAQLADALHQSRPAA